MKSLVRTTKRYHFCYKSTRNIVHIIKTNMKPRDYNPNGILMPNINFSRLLFLEAVYIKLFHIEKKHSNLARAIDLLNFDYFYV